MNTLSFNSDAFFNRKGILISIILVVASIVLELIERGTGFVLGPWFGTTWFTLKSSFFFTGCLMLLFGVLIYAPMLRLFSVGSVRIIKKGRHYPNKLTFPLFIDKSTFFSIDKTFIFHDSCLYYFGDTDDNDKNKLFGFTWCLLPRVRTKKWAIDKDVRVWFKFMHLVVIKPHHWNSVRFGWNCNWLTQQIKLAPYVFRRGERIFYPDMTYLNGSLVLLNVEKEYNFSLSLDKDSGEVRFKVYRDLNPDMPLDFVKVTFDIPKKKKLYYYLDLYFGGNKIAPHNLTITES